MTFDNPEDEATAPLDGLFRQLVSATPGERANLVLRLLDHYPVRRLELPADGAARATLDEIDLGRGSLQARQEDYEVLAPWWDLERLGINLRRANLRGASLKRAKLHGALLEEVDLEGADLAGADLRETTLAEANLRDALLEEASLAGASLRFARLEGALLEGANLRGADLWGVVGTGAVLSRVDLQRATLEEANLAGADLREADLRGANLKRASLRGANLEGADLRGSELHGADLDGAVLREAKLQGCNLGHCRIAHVHFSDAWLEKTRLRREQLAGAIGEELAREYELARRGYLTLERNFEEVGDYDAGSWAYRRKRRMQKWKALQQARQAHRGRHWVKALEWYATFVKDQLVEWLCDYGESVPRVLGAMFAVYLIFALVYGLTGGVVRVEQTADGVVRTTTHHPADLAVFSLLAMATQGTPAGLEPSNEIAHLLQGVEALLTIFLLGLLGFVVGNRIRR